MPDNFTGHLITAIISLASALAFQYKVRNNLEASMKLQMEKANAACLAENDVLKKTVATLQEKLMELHYRLGQMEGSLGHRQSIIEKELTHVEKRSAVRGDKYA